MLKRNALPLIQRALEEKREKISCLPGEKDPVEAYLIKISGDIDPFENFRAMYQGINEKAFKKTKKRLWGLVSVDRKPLQNHGVLIAPKTMRIIFSFNMAFADLHREKKRLVRFPPLEIFPIVIPDDDAESSCFGERAEKLVEKYGYFPRGRVANCLLSFSNALSKHIVTVQLPGGKVYQDLCLIKIWAKTNFAEDFKVAYPDSKPVETFPIKEAFREYGIFIRPDDLKIVFAFNTSFARYDAVEKTVLYEELAESILKLLPLKPKRTDGKTPKKLIGLGYVPHVRTDMGMRGVIMYALSDPSQ